MVAPILYAAGSAVSAYFTTKAVEEKKAERKLELVSKLAELTPEQARAVEAVKGESVGDLEERIRMGIGPFGVLPGRQKKVKDISEERTKAAKALTERVLRSIPPDERKRIQSNPGLLRAVVNRAMADESSKGFLVWERDRQF